MVTVLQGLKKELARLQVRNPVHPMIKDYKRQIAAAEAPGESAFDLMVTGPIKGNVTRSPANRAAD